MLRVPMLFFCTFFITACQPVADDTFAVTTDASYSATLSQDGQHALISTASNGVQLWSLANKQLKYQWVHGAKNTSNVFDTAISNNNLYAATLASDSVAIWNMQSGESIGWWALPAYAQSIALANNGHALIGLVDGSVMSLLPNNQGLIQFLGHKEKINSVSISDDGQFALSGGNDGLIILWQATTGHPLQQWQLESRITKVLLSPSGLLSFASDIAGNASIWQSNDGLKVSSLDIKRRQMTFSSARFIQQDQQLLTGTPSKEVFLWQVDSGKRLQRWQVQVTKNSQNRGAVVYSVAQPSNGSIVSVSSQGLIETWHVK